MRLSVSEDIEVITASETNNWLLRLLDTTCIVALTRFDLTTEEGHSLNVHKDYFFSDMTWGEEVGDLTEKDISAEEQDRLLSEYERELLTKKMKNGGGGGEAKKGSSTVEDSIGEELAKLDMKEKKKGAKGATPAGRKAVSPDKGMRGRVSCRHVFS